MAKDPRLSGIPLSINEELQDRAIRHSLFLEGFKTSEVKDMLQFLDREVLPDLLDQIQSRLSRIEDRGFDLGPDTTKRLQRLASGIDQFVDESTRVLQKNLSDNLTEFANQEIEFTSGIYDLVADVEFELPPPSVVKSILTSRPFDGELMKDHFDNFSETQKLGISRAIRLGVAQGESTAQIIRRIRGTRRLNFGDGVFGVTRRQAEAFTRTAVNHVATHARESVFEENKRLIKGVQWIATLDTRTCPQCGALDGEVFPVGEGERPPAHFNCRCTTTALLKRQGDPDRLSYNDWLKRQSPDIQNRALGPKRAELFRKGDLSITNFVNPAGNIIPLKDLRKLEADAFKKARVPAPVTPERNLRLLEAEAKDFTVAQGQKTGHEWMVAYDKDTLEELARTTSKKAGSVQLGPELLREIDKTDRKIVLHHNHPNSTSLSPADMKVSTFPGVDEIIAHGHDGSFYSGKSLAMENVKGRGFKTAIFRLDNATRRLKENMIKLVQSRVDSGALPAEVANNQFWHLMNIGLDKLGETRYRFSLSATRQAEFDRYKDMFDAVIDLAVEAS